MNYKWLEIFGKYRQRKYERDLDKLRNDLASRGLTSSGIRNNEERWLKEDYEDEMQMKEEEISIYDTERTAQRTERKNSIFTNRILASVAVLGFFMTSAVSWFTIQNAREVVELELKANEINEQITKLERDNSQPFLVTVGRYEGGTAVRIQNVGGGPAKDTFFKVPSRW